VGFFNFENSKNCVNEFALCIPCAFSSKTDSFFMCFIFECEVFVCICFLALIY